MVAGIIHAVAPFASDPDWHALLRAAFCSSFDLAWGTAAPRPVASLAAPLLGAGAKGADAADAIDAAAAAATEWAGGASTAGADDDGLAVEARVLRFALQEEAHVQALGDALAARGWR